MAGSSALTVASISTACALLILVNVVSYYSKNENQLETALLQTRNGFQPMVLRQPRTQALDLGVSWAQGYGFNQGFEGEPIYYPYVEQSATAAVLETEDKNRLSTEAKYPFVKYYGQGVDFIHGNSLDPSYYNYHEQGANDAGYSYDNTLESYSKFIGLEPDLDRALLDFHDPF